jgi:hypothetical protein
MSTSSPARRLAHIQFIKDLIDALATHGRSVDRSTLLALAADIKQEIDVLARSQETPRRRWTDTPAAAS